MKSKIACLFFVLILNCGIAFAQTDSGLDEEEVLKNSLLALDHLIQSDSVQARIETSFDDETQREIAEILMPAVAADASRTSRAVTQMCAEWIESTEIEEMQKVVDSLGKYDAVKSQRDPAVINAFNNAYDRIVASLTAEEKEGFETFMMKWERRLSHSKQIPYSEFVIAFADPKATVEKSCGDSK